MIRICWPKFGTEKSTGEEIEIAVVTHSSLLATKIEMSVSIIYSLTVQSY
jgi:hypothetical protein